MLKNIVRLLIYILIAIIIICVFILSRRIWFIQKYEKKIKEYQSNFTNCYVKETYYSKYDNWETEYFYKDNMFKFRNNDLNISDGHTFYTNLDTKKEVIVYEKEKKFQIFDVDAVATITAAFDSLGYTYCESIKEKLDFISEIGFIRLDKCNGKQCYLIEIHSGIKVWLDIETFLPVKMLGNSTSSTLERGTVDGIVEYNIKINQVTDEDVTVPDLSGYTLLENE